jgi:hypothetical protein
MTPVRVVYRKYDGSLHWHMDLGRLGADEYGTWLGAPAGSQGQRGSEEPVTFSHAYVLLIPWSGGLRRRSLRPGRGDHGAPRRAGLTGVASGIAWEAAGW